jgi:hypothetical protein
MPVQDNLRLEYEVFGNEGTVYPGHPTSLALLIMMTFDSFVAASTRHPQQPYPAALGSQSIPGAGGNVYSALELLAYARKHGAKAALEWGDACWRRAVGPDNFGDRYEPGQAQADAIKEKFRALATDWLQRELHAA